MEEGGTKVVCAVYGPHECRHRSRVKEDSCLINAQYSMCTFSVTDRKNRPRGDRRSNGYSRLLERTFESVILTTLYPRSQIDIFCEIFEVNSVLSMNLFAMKHLHIKADGGSLAACVNCATLALADAGVPMRGLATAVECASVEGVACADTSSREHTEVVPRMTIGTVGKP